MLYRITYFGDKGTILSVLDPYYDEGYLTTGIWEKPSSNTREESSAFGAVEALSQSSQRYAFDTDEDIIKVQIEYGKET